MEHLGCSHANSSHDCCTQLTHFGRHLSWTLTRQDAEVSAGSGIALHQYAVSPRCCQCIRQRRLAQLPLKPSSTWTLLRFGSDLIMSIDSKW